MRKLIVAIAMVLLACGGAVAQDRTFRLVAPAELSETGFLKYLLPRFSLKTGIRITVVAPGDDADAAFGDNGVPVFEGLGTLWHYEHTPNPHTDRFAEWLTSDIGRDTIGSFESGGAVTFAAYVAAPKEKRAVAPTGDVVAGEANSMLHCGRCHVVSEKNRMNAIGSTPSFSLLRTFPDWQNRFEAFYVLKPHPAFTQIAEVTEPFHESRPSPIVPIELTLDELDAILAFVATIEPADLGAPIQLR
ncbi:MAG: hypothetical protein KJN93_09815 [Alphaproteobacteria bacterium]|nr:hypothetical protein [Alphaproteobacteria bacterium]NNF24935.1 hypothetical protein [Paracoccaceae bacterium]